MNKYKLFQDWGVTATIATLVIVGGLVIIGRVIDRANADTVIALVGSWISAIVSAIVVIKSGKKVV